MIPIISCIEINSRQNGAVNRIQKLLSKFNKKLLGVRTVVISIVTVLVSMFILASVVTINLNLVVSWSSYWQNIWGQFWNLIVYLIGGRFATSITFEGWLSIGIIKVAFKTIISALSVLVTGFTVAAITSYMVEKILRRLMGMSLPVLMKHTVVCGWNPSAELIVKRIHDEDPDEPVVLVCDRDKAPMTGKNLYWVRGDHTKVDMLEKAHIKKANTAIILSDVESAGNSKELADARTVLSVLTVENLHPEIHSAAELLDPSNENHLRRANVDEIVISGELSGTILSRVSENKGLSRVVKSLLTVGEGSEIYRLTELPEIVNSGNFGDLHVKLYKDSGYILLGFENENGDVNISPPTGTKLQDATALYIISEEKPVLV